jgi:hypothetical protein
MEAERYAELDFKAEALPCPCRVVGVGEVLTVSTVPVAEGDLKSALARMESATANRAAPRLVSRGSICLSINGARHVNRFVVLFFFAYSVSWSGSPPLTSNRGTYW